VPAALGNPFWEMRSPTSERLFMGDQAIDQPARCTSAPEAAYRAAVSDSHRKRLGQFFTPPAVARFMAAWIAGNHACRTILDPAVGLGMLLRAMLEQPHSATYTLRGYDIDPVVCKQASALFAHVDHADIKLLNQDYLFNHWDDQYDGIICNPPYIKFQHYTNRAAALQELQSRLGITLSGFTNIYTMFLLKSLHQLAPGGRAAYIVPSEFLNAGYGTAIKRYLLQSKLLRYVLVFDSDSTIFDNVLTTSCILLLANDDHDRGITFISAPAVDDLADLAGQLASYPAARLSGKTIRQRDLDPHIKWRVYYQQRSSSSYTHLVPLSTYGKIVRGIATGDNAYFTFDTQKTQAFGIPNTCLLPCITKATQAGTAFFTQQHFDDLHANGKRVLLFNAIDPAHPLVAAYLALGVEQAVHRRYLTSHRTPWFAIEQRPPAPILVTAFNRNGLRFVRNEAQVRNLTCFHGFYINDRALPRLDLLMAYLLTDVAREILSDDRREYSGGLQKFEPNDLNQAKALDIDIIDGDTERKILKLYAAYRSSVLQQRADGKLLAQLNMLFLHLLRT
jgi:adenine-specific DNA-methyltransferase